MAKRRASEQEIALQLLYMCWTMDDKLGEWYENGLHFRGVKVMPPKVEGGDWLAVVNGTTSDGDVVAFVSSETFEGVLKKVVGGLSSGSLKWKRDEPR